MSAALCRSCRAPMAAADRFCSACGSPTREHVRSVDDRSRSSRRVAARAALALGIACTATLFGLVGTSVFGDERHGVAAAVVGGAVILTAGLAASTVLGAWRETAPIGRPLHWCLLALPVGALTLLTAWGYVRLLHPSGGGGEADATLWLSAVVLAPLLEEWLCRGVAFTAASRLTNARGAVVLTAVLFAFLHGLGGHLLALPHRFVSGLAYGWLRAKSGSLVPGVVAHAVHNVLAIAWLGD
jgi:membrane protease YdiL (CAAX protease family)